MLNRTQQSTSATLNRHDLGTRQVAFAAITNMGCLSLRTRHAHPQPVVEPTRAGILRGLSYLATAGYPRPGTPGSSVLPAWHSAKVACMSGRPLVAFKDPMSVVDPVDRPRRSGVQARARQAEVALTGILAEG